MARVLNTSDNSDALSQGSTNLYVTSSEKAKITGLSGSNTGDQTLSINGQIITISGANGNSITIPSGTGGAAFTPMDTYFVASSTSSAAEKASAQYVCTGTNDDVIINQALQAAKANGGGKVVLGIGTFNISASLYIEGVNTPDDAPTIVLNGSGIDGTRLIGAANVNVIVLRYMPKPQIRDMTITFSGTADGIKCIANTTGANDRRGFWMGTIENLYFKGDGTNSGWCLNLENAFRSFFKNLGTGNGIKNGMRFASTYSQFNPGNCVVMTCQMGLSVANGTAYKCESADDGGFMNIMSFLECDAIDTANSTTSIGWHFKGSGTSYFTTRDIRVQGANPEQFNTAIKLEHAANIRFLGDFINPKTGGFVVDATADSVNNRVEVEYIYVNGTSTVNAFRDLNTDALKPNYFFNSFARVESGGTLTTSPSTASVMFNLARDSDGTGVYPIQFASNYQLATKAYVDTKDAGDVQLAGAQTITGAKTFSSNVIMSSGATMNATSIVTDTTTGLKMGTATTQKVGFFNATPVAQQAAITDLGVVLSSLGFRAVGTNYNISTSGSLAFGGSTRTGAVSLVGTSGMNNFCNATTASFTVTLPNTTSPGLLFMIKKIDSSANTVTVAGTIDGVTNYVLSTQYKYVTVCSTTTSGVWYVVANN